MADNRELADRVAEVEVSPPELLAKGYREFWRYRSKLKDGRGTVEQTRDLIRGGKVVAVLPLDLSRDEIVLIRQFRLAAHLANGCGELVECVAGRTEPGETPVAAARRECAEEIGVAPDRLVESFSYLTTPGVTDEEITVFLAAVDASRAVAHPVSPDGERVATMRVPIEAALAALSAGSLHNGPLIIALQWLALNRGRVEGLLAS